MAADLLISSDVRPSTATSFPLAPDFDTDLVTPEFYPVRLQQKLHIISDRICIAYAGRPDRAEHIIRLAKRRKVPPSGIKQFLAD